jgi:hypothetical protein
MLFGDNGDKRVSEGHSDSALAQVAKEISGLLPVFALDLDVGDDA